MLKFFTGLFGGVYYGGRYLYERSRDKEYDRRVALVKSNIEKAKLVYCNIEKEREIAEYIATGKNFEEICDLLKEDLQFVFGDEYKSKLQIPPYYKYGYGDSVDTHTDWVKFLLLAKNGLVGYMSIVSGYSAKESIYNPYNRLFAKRLALHFKQISPELKLCELADKQVLRNVVFEKFTYCTDIIDFE